MKLSSQRLVFSEQPAQADQAVDSRCQILEQHGLHQVVMSTALKCGDGAFHRRIGGDHDEQSLGPELERPVEDGDPIGARQLDVAEDDLGLERFDLGER